MLSILVGLLVYRRYRNGQSPIHIFPGFGDSGRKLKTFWSPIDHSLLGIGVDNGKDRLSGSVAGKLDGSTSASSEPERSAFMVRAERPDFNRDSGTWDKLDYEELPFWDPGSQTIESRLPHGPGASRMVHGKLSTSSMVSYASYANELELPPATPVRDTVAWIRPSDQSPIGSTQPHFYPEGAEFNGWSPEARLAKKFVSSTSLGSVYGPTGSAPHFYPGSTGLNSKNLDTMPGKKLASSTSLESVYGFGGLESSMNETTTEFDESGLVKPVPFRSPELQSEVAKLRAELDAFEAERLRGAELLMLQERAEVAAQLLEPPTKLRAFGAGSSRQQSRGYPEYTEFELSDDEFGKDSYDRGSSELQAAATQEVEYLVAVG